MQFRYASNSLFIFTIIITVILLLSSCASSSVFKQRNVRQAQLYYGEDHLVRIKQLTFTGENTHASFSSDAKKIIFQSTRDSLRCDAIYTMNRNGDDINLISSGKGVASSARLSPNNDYIVFSSTHLLDYECPPKPEFSKDYVWLQYSDYDIFVTSSTGGSAERIGKSNSYDGGAVYSPSGDKIIFTSSRTGDHELFIMNADGSHVKQLTHAKGYDGDAVFSPNGKYIVWRGSRPKGDALHDYHFQMSQGILRAGKFELFMMKLDGGKPIQLTRNKATNFSPTFNPAGTEIIFSSNMSEKDGRNYDLYVLNIKTRKLERLTYYSGFDGYPVFSPDGKKLLFTSSRNFRYKAEKNIFMVDWVAEGIYTR